MDKPLVSILIPVYNREKIIEETIASALNQTYENFEIIIVDNCSTDNTWNILVKLVEKNERIQIFQNKTNLGPVRNWEQCIKYATGKYGKILWSDDLIDKNFLKKTIPLLKNDVGFVFTPRDTFNNNKELVNIGDYLYDTGIYPAEKYIYDILLPEKFVPVSPGCAIYKMDVLKKHLLINIPNNKNIDFSQLGAGNDLLLFLLSFQNYPNYGYVNEKLSLFRDHDESISIKTNNGKLQFLYLYSKAYFIDIYKGKINIDTIKNFNALIKISLLKFPNNEYMFNKIQDFYRVNRITSYSLIYLIRFILLKLWKKLS